MPMSRAEGCVYVRVFIEFKCVCVCVCILYIQSTVQYV